jgi:hypothetical protein
MKDFDKALYEGTLVAFSKTLSKSHAFAQGPILRDVGKDLVEYLQQHGFEFEETGRIEDHPTLIRVLLESGFAKCCLGWWVAGMPPGHHAGARRSTNSGTRIRLREAHSVRGHAIQNRGLDLPLTITPQIAVAEIVGEVEHDLGTDGRSRASLPIPCRSRDARSIKV